MDEPAPYPPHRKGERIRRIPFPVAAPPRVPAEPAKVKRKDGGEVDLWATLGVRRPVADLDDLGVTDWAPWPP